MRSRSAFTLIEVLIVVVIVSILAGTALSRITGSAEDAKRATVLRNLQILRNSLNEFKLHHGDVPPTLAGGTLPQFLSRTNAAGQVGATANHKFGPYVLGGVLPVNSLDGKNTVSATTVFPPTVATAAGGWLYHEATGRIAINHADFLTH